jgi:hypothetical protein
MFVFVGSVQPKVVDQPAVGAECPACGCGV